MKTLFQKKECHVPKWFVIDAEGQTLGRLATEGVNYYVEKKFFYTLE
jgi:ribosomal protein L13